MPATNELLQEGRYRIQTSSQSGDEKVFEAYDTVRNAKVIVREIPVKLNKVSTVSQRESLQLEFANHAKALTEVEHESLVHVHDYFSEIDRQYLVTEAVDGESLDKLISRNQKPFPVTEVTAWADELLDALNYLHTRKPPIIHRNINPSNLRLHSSGKIKLVGVGVDTGSDSDFASTYHTDGDLRYSPLEQIWPGLDPASQKAITNHYDDRSERILKQPLDERSDIYSLGATLYYLITGVEPVDPIERSIEILEGKLDPLREPTNVDSQIPPEISDVLMKALEIKRENRYDAAVIMRQVLKTALTRVREREEDDNRELTDAPAVTRTAPASKPDAALAEQQRIAAEAEKQRQKELMERQLRQAEEERVRAEQAAAEATLAEMLRAEEAAQAAPGDHPDPELLDISVEPSAEVVAYRDTNEVDEDELAAVLSQLEKAESSVSAKREVESATASEANDVTVYDAPIDLAPQPSAAASDDADVKDIFSMPAKTGSGFPIPAIAGIVGLVVVIAVGAWYAMSGSSETKKPAPAPTLQAAQPTPAPVDPAAETIASTQTPDEAAQPDESTEPQTAATIRAAPAARPKKVESAKPETAKKKVTVDDLINDN
jgi:serine/threonine protein kinase